MYLKVPDRKKPGEQVVHDTTVEEVQQVLPADTKAKAEFNQGINYVIVDFPEGTPYKEYQRESRSICKIKDLRLIRSTKAAGNLAGCFCLATAASLVAVAT